MAVGPGALQFTLDNRARIAPGAPLIFGGVDDDNGAVKGRTLPADVKGVVSSFDLPRTIDLARRLQPEVKRAVVLTGSADFDRRWEKTARETLKGYRDLDVQYVSGLTLDGFKQEAKQLQSNVILIILSMFQGADGRKFMPREAFVEIAAASGAPAYSVYSPVIGLGVLGGYVETFESMGQNMAALTDQYLAGGPPTPQTIHSQGEAAVDWRQMQAVGHRRCEASERRRVAILRTDAPGKDIARRSLARWPSLSSRWPRSRR